MVKKYVIFIYFLAMLILLAMAVTSCRSVRYVPVETVKHDSVYFNKMVRDSVFVKDSVLVVKGDTVTEYRWKYVFKYKNRTDTLYVSRTDTIRVPYPVEAKLTKWQQFKMEAGGYAIALAIPDVKGRFFISRQGSNTLCDSEQPYNRAVVRRYRGNTDYGR